MSASTENRTSRSLVYGLSLLRLFTTEQPVRGIAELAEQMCVSRPTAHRYASTCLELGYLEQAPMRRYRLARLSTTPGLTMISSLPITQPARPILRALRAETGRTVSQAVLCGGDVLYLERLCGYERGQYRLERGLGAGSRRPAEATAAGLALIAALEDIDQCGHGSDRPQLTVADGGLHDDARGLALTVRAGNEMTSAIEITLPAPAIPADAMTAELGDLLRGAASDLHAALSSDGVSRPDGLAS
jgi:DNA-binding IclR family transcriptional regulator